MMKKWHFFIIALCFWLSACNMSSSFTPEETVPDATDPADILLYQKWPFPVGVAVQRSAFGGFWGSSPNPLLKYFNVYVAENEMKPESLQPSRENFSWGNGDTLVQYSQDNGKKARGHVLIWHSQIRDWFFQNASGGTATKEELYANMKNHIQTIMTHYKGKVDSWDVANEMISDDASGASGTLEGITSDLRNSKFRQIAGSPEFLLKAFQWAHEADPDAKLYLTDYSTEYYGSKQNAFYNLAKWLVDNGAPIDGVGFQCHMHYNWPLVEQIGGLVGASIDRFAALGLKSQITELDISLYAWKDTSLTLSEAELQERLAIQKDLYLSLFNMAEQKYREGKLTMLVLWGLSDNLTWLNDYPEKGRRDYPLLFDRNNQPKDIYRALVSQ
ncbi:endo-1,4-beta-xylanase [Leadbettera azotonutricia]|uniref:Beta-xylanase n=1 Tax=Leadbettera azotonutricia (strain ATCC BAA-888 / DSM 13862 / ZAS-9) TaxID=545695 RepID=F5YDP7_LEAAZ|nr:endo-1,4-beta-xylanase [Leadbettera azotonutricia]AEF82584.1 glycosyl hydrolase family 10 [Leadbettera azotonutricia ZAS-9]